MIRDWLKLLMVMKNQPVEYNYIDGCFICVCAMYQVYYFTDCAKYEMIVHNVHNINNFLCAKKKFAGNLTFPK